MNLEKKNILIVLPSDNLGGAEQILKMVALYYHNDNVSVFILSKRKGNGWRSIEEKHRVTYQNTNNVFFGALLFSLQMLFNREKYSYSYSSQTLISGILGILRSFRILKTDNLIVRESTSVFMRFSGFKLWLYKLMYSKGYKFVDLVICQTEIMRSQLIEKFFFLRDKTIVLHNPINFANKKIISINPLNFAYIVSAGRLIPEKGYDILIKAFAESIKVHRELHLVILGEGKERNALEQLCADLLITHRVHFLGFVKNVYTYFSFAEACIVSSRIEGFPNVLLQMMSVNTSVVSTYCAGGVEEIEGIIGVPIENEELLEKGILSALEYNSKINRRKFDEYLRDKNINNFIKSIELNLKTIIKNDF